MRAITPVCWLLFASAGAWLHVDVAAVPLEHPNLGIYGGSAVNITEVPYMAQLLVKQADETDYEFECGASIIHEQFLVTAAHCIFWEILLNFSWKILVGSDKIGIGQEYEVNKIILHPDFDYITLDYDISVIQLKKKLTFSDRVKPINMTDSSFTPYPGDLMVTMGFGRTENRIYPEDLIKVDIPYENQEECRKDYQFSENKVTERMICTKKEGLDTCKDDSGGPLVYKEHLIGVVSWGIVCGKTPGVYAYITPLRSWVEETIKNNTFFV